MTDKQFFGDTPPQGSSGNEMIVPSTHISPRPYRNVGASILNGMRGKCPNCGKGHLFSNWLKIADHCDHCHEELFHQRADDLPAYLNIFLVGHVIVGGMLFLTTYEIFDMWTMTAIAVVLAIGAALLGLRPIKGGVVGAQWAMHMHGFGGDET